jgi:H/ACA ribonucleoprotein complex subunit 2
MANELEGKVEDYNELIRHVSPLAHPLCSQKLNKRVLKVVKKASAKKNIKRGVKEVVKSLRKGAKGLVVIAGDIFPIDVMTHLAVLCEDADVPYCYVPSKDHLGQAGSTKRPTSCVMIETKKDVDYEEAYNEILDQVKVLNEKMIVTV